MGIIGGNSGLKNPAWVDEVILNYNLKQSIIEFAASKDPVNCRSIIYPLYREQGVKNKAFEDLGKAKRDFWQSVYEIKIIKRFYDFLIRMNHRLK